MSERMVAILKKIDLGHLGSIFSSEKVTPDIIPKLSLVEFEKLGITSRSQVMRLRVECCVYGSQSPVSTLFTCGAPKFFIPSAGKSV